MANFHPDLYVWMVKNFDKESQRANELINFLSLASVIEL
jgi:4-hydroxy-tetrahydrodipicolinate synthase